MRMRPAHMETTCGSFSLRVKLKLLFLSLGLAAVSIWLFYTLWPAPSISVNQYHRIANDMGRPSGITLDEVEKIMGRRPDGTLPLDFREMLSWVEGDSRISIQVGKWNKVTYVEFAGPENRESFLDWLKAKLGLPGG